MTNIDTALVERARELLVTELRCDGAHLLAGMIENLNDGAILSNPPTSSAIRAIVAALQSTREKKLEEALRLALSRMAHKASCHSVRPTEEWAEHGGVSLENCDCQIKVVKAALSYGEREAREWRPITASEPLADGETSYLCIREAGAIIPFVACRDDDGWTTFNCWYETTFGKKYEPSHYMPLPPPPAQQPAVGEESGE